jgi:hypothetical protein
MTRLQQWFIVSTALIPASTTGNDKGGTKVAQKYPFSAILGADVTT